MDAEDDFQEDEPQADEWEEFRGDDIDFIGFEELKRLDLQAMPEDAHIQVLADYFPETTIWRESETERLVNHERRASKY
jgi:hypothetical protein